MVSFSANSKMMFLSTMALVAVPAFGIAAGIDESSATSPDPVAKEANPEVMPLYEPFDGKDNDEHNAQDKDENDFFFANSIQSAGHRSVPSFSPENYMQQYGRPQVGGDRKDGSPGDAAATTTSGDGAKRTAAPSRRASMPASVYGSGGKKVEVRSQASRVATLLPRVRRRSSVRRASSSGTTEIATAMMSPQAGVSYSRRCSLQSVAEQDPFGIGSSSSVPEQTVAEQTVAERKPKRANRGRRTSGLFKTQGQRAIVQPSNESEKQDFTSINPMQDGNDGKNEVIGYDEVYKQTVDNSSEIFSQEHPAIHSANDAKKQAMHLNLFLAPFLMVFFLHLCWQMFIHAGKCSC